MRISESLLRDLIGAAGLVLLGLLAAAWFLIGLPEMPSLASPINLETGRPLQVTLSAQSAPPPAQVTVRITVVDANTSQGDIAALVQVWIPDEHLLALRDVATPPICGGGKSTATGTVVVVRRNGRLELTDDCYGQLAFDLTLLATEGGATHILIGLGSVVDRPTGFTGASFATSVALPAFASPRAFPDDKQWYAAFPSLSYDRLVERTATGFAFYADVRFEIERSRALGSQDVSVDTSVADGSAPVSFVVSRDVVTRLWVYGAALLPTALFLAVSLSSKSNNRSSTQPDIDVLNIGISLLAILSLSTLLVPAEAETPNRVQLLLVGQIVAFVVWPSWRDWLRRAHVAMRSAPDPASPRVGQGPPADPGTIDRRPK